MKKIAIVYLCTGDYTIFEKEFYTSCENLFLPERQKDYYIFTDRISDIEKADNKYIQFQEKLGWPYDVLIKWDCIYRIREKLACYDYVVLCNANMKFVNKTDIPDLQKDFILTSFLKNKDSFEFENNKRSKAYIKDIFSIERYIQTGFIIGKTSAFLEATETMREWTSADLERKIIPIWHDESYFNAYIYNLKNASIAFWDYEEVMPSEWMNEKNESVVKAVFMDKNQFGGHDSLRNHKTTSLEKRMKALKKWIVKRKLQKKIREIFHK